MAATPLAFDLRTLPGLGPDLPWPPPSPMDGRPEPCLHAREAGPVRVHLLALPLDPGPWLRALGPMASEPRRTRAAEFHAPMDALRCLAAEALLRQALGEIHGLPPSRCRPALTPEGKPYLPDHPGIHFNLSHSGPWVLCATHRSPVGIDVEEPRPGAPLPATSVLADQELRRFTALPPPAARVYFYRLWTLKESLLKALGTGLGLDPRSVTLSLDPGPITAHHASLALADYEFIEIPLPGESRAAVCYC